MNVKTQTVLRYGVESIAEGLILHKLSSILSRSSSIILSSTLSPSHHAPAECPTEHDPQENIMDPRYW